MQYLSGTLLTQNTKYNVMLLMQGVFGKFLDLVCNFETVAHTGRLLR